MPLDPESRLNRKLAKQIYNTEKQEKLKEARQKILDEHQKSEEDKAKKYKKVEKKVLADKKDRDAAFKDKFEKIEEKRVKAFTTFKKDRHDFELDLRIKQQELKEKDDLHKLEIEKAASEKAIARF